jgi:L-seryl-tRNA(Ser) seleniumtransferase
MQDLAAGYCVKQRAGDWKPNLRCRSVYQAGTEHWTFSGDKLREDLRWHYRGESHLCGGHEKNQLTRALRVDKLTIAALEATLIEYMAGFSRAELL